MNMHNLRSHLDSKILNTSLFVGLTTGLAVGGLLYTSRVLRASRQKRKPRWITLPNDHTNESALDVISRDLKAHGTLPKGVDTSLAVRSVECHLANRLSGGEASVFVSQLPDDLKNIIADCGPVREHTRDVFGKDGYLERVSSDLKITKEQAQVLIRDIFTHIHLLLSSKEVKDIASQLPGDMKTMWLRPELH